MMTSYTQTDNPKRIIGRLILIMTALFIWILIDVGYVYGQSTRSATKPVAAFDNEPMAREGDEKGDIYNDPKGESGFEILPNPTKGSMVFDFEFIIRDGSEETSVDVFDAMGRLAAHYDVDVETLEIGLKVDLTQELPGTYIAVVRNGDQMFTKRILKI